MTRGTALGRVRLALVGLIVVAAVGCSGRQEQAADGDGRVVVEDHTEPDGRVVRAGLGDITYQTHFEGEKEGLGLAIEVTNADGRRSTTFPLPEIDEEFQVLGGFGGELGHVSVFAAPAGTVLRVRYRSGDEYALDVELDGLAVVVVPSADALDRVHATGPDGRECRFLRAPSSGIDCEPA